MEKIVYQEMNTAGVFFHPIYTEENIFVNLGNSFYKIGIEVLFKTNVKSFCFHNVSCK